jgi:serine protease DegS
MRKTRQKLVENYYTVYFAPGLAFENRMKKLFAFIFWPTLAGLVFAFTLLQAPRLVELMPGLATYFPQPTASVSNITSFSYAITRSAPAVVSINFKEDAQRIMQRFENYVFDSVEDDEARLGSGIIVSPDGYIVTSYHVVYSRAVERAFFSRELIVTLSNGRNVEGRIVSLDESSDLALLKIDAEGLPSVNVANMSQLRVGDIVLAIGNPRNVGQSVTQGIISAFRSLGDSFIIQTDAAINPGNSGGALVNIAGELIGINSTIVSESGGSEGIGFSIPATKALDMLANYLASGPSGYLGVNTSPITQEEGREMFDRDVQGFLVNKVDENGAADKAGIRAGDVIAGFGDHWLSVVDPSDIPEAWAALSAVSDLPPGEEIVVHVYRDGTFIDLTAVLGVGEPQVYEVPVPEFEPELGPAVSSPLSPI